MSHSVDTSYPLEKLQGFTINETDIFRGRNNLRNKMINKIISTKSFDYSIPRWYFIMGYNPDLVNYIINQI